MEAPFAQWLGRPTTLCFLRRVLATTGDAIPTRIHSSPQRNVRRRDVHTATELSQPPNGRSDEEQDGQSKRPRSVIRRFAVSDGGTGDALRMSLNSGVKLLDETTPPEQAYKALWLQVNVGSRSRVGQLVVDSPEHRGNMRLWVELLEHRQRLDGFNGVQEVWKGMRYRNVDLPVSGPEADILWTTLIHACIATSKSHSDDHKKLLGDVMKHAKELHDRDGALWPSLYRCLVGRFLRIMPVMARVWHNQLVSDFGTSVVTMANLAGDCAASLEAGNARRVFINICKITNQPPYDLFMPEFVKHVDDQTALRSHQTLLRAGHGPSAGVFALPSIQRLFELDKDKFLPMIHQSKDVAVPDTAIARHAPLTRANMSTWVGNAHGIRPKEVSDTFVAKMFATRAFTLDLVVKGLGFFGVDSLGPLALHEMALKSETPVEFCNRLGELKTMDIATDKSVYGRLLRKVAIDGPAHLFQLLLSSDQHPESYEDPETQEALLVSFLEKQDMPSAHTTLLALSLTGEMEHTRAWNRVLQHYITERNFLAIDRTMRHMQSSKMPPTKRTLNFIDRALLPYRAPGKAPRKTRSHDGMIVRPLQFATNAYMFAAQNGVYVPQRLWRELLRRYGMEFRWDECERLAWWLVTWYGKNVDSRDRRGRRDHWYGMQMLDVIFDAHMRKALIHWAFRCAGHSKLLYKGASYSKPDAVSEDPCEPWARGIVLLKRMREYGIQVSLNDIRSTLIVRLIPLFGPAYSIKRINEEARRYNKLSLADYIRHANEICGVNLFNVEPEMLNDDPANRSKLMVHIFKPRRRVSKWRKEHADIAGYARALESGIQLPAVSKVGQRMARWKSSPFNLVRTRPHGSTLASSDARSHRSLRSRQSPSARSSSSHPPPSLGDTREPA